MSKVNEYCENCKFWKCMGYHYYECVKDGSARSRGETCNQFEEE